MTLRRKFDIVMAIALAVSLLVLLGSHLLQKSAHFHYLERQHLAHVAELKLAAAQAALGAAVDKQAALLAVDGALDVAHHADYEVTPAEKKLFRAMGFGELMDLPYQGIAALDRMRAAIVADPGSALTPALVEKMRPDILAVEDSANRFAPLTAEAAQFIKRVVFVMDAGGALVLLAVLWAIRRAVLPPLERALRVAGRIAEGDLSATVQGDSHDEVGRLMAALGHMQASLAGVVARLQHASGQLQLASTDIAQRNEDLSRRTESQASALEETAASMEELRTAIQQNAAGAQQASALAGEAASIALQGGKVVAQVVDKMKGIHADSRNISEIITLIDGIAFQTNILALNASVEAARAGEQGRGFAVVAGEVRELAARSARAARQIKDLIDASVARAGEAAGLADRAGNAVGEAIAAIGRVSALIAEISKATTEQSSGVEQVGSALTQLDGVTQKNSVLVGHLADAAAALKAQAHELVAAMAVFRVAEYVPVERADEFSSAVIPLARRHGKTGATA